MLIYILTIIITVALAWLLEHVKQKKIIFSGMVMVPAFVSGLRGVGTDYFGYKLRYDKVLEGIRIDLDGTNLTGIFYKILSFIGKLLWGYQSVIFLFSFLTIGICFYIFFKMRKEISLTFAVFSYMSLFYLYSFNLFRQLLSAELFLLALLFMREKKCKKIVIIPMVLSLIIHSSSIIYLCLFFLIPLIKRSSKLRKCIYFLSLMFIMLIPYLASVLGKLTSVFPHYAYYFLHFRYMGLGLGIFRYVLLIWIPVFLVAYKKSLFSCNIISEYQEYVFIIMMGSIFSLLSYVSDTFIYRIGYTGLCALPVLLGVFVKKIKREKLLVELMLSGVHILFFLYDFFCLNTGEIIPYIFF